VAAFATVLDGTAAPEGRSPDAPRTAGEEPAPGRATA
jgi:hypothetical protein